MYIGESDWGRAGGVQSLGGLGRWSVTSHVNLGQPSVTTFIYQYTLVWLCNTKMYTHTRARARTHTHINKHTDRQTDRQTNTHTGLGRLAAADCQEVQHIRKP